MKIPYNNLSIALLALFLAGCVKETDDPAGHANTGEVEAGFHISLPADDPSITNPVSAMTRSATQENTIRTIDILAFRINADNTEYFDYYAEGKPASGAGTSKQTFRASIRVKEYKQRFVVIANARDEVMKLIGSVEWRKAPKDGMLRMLEFTNRASDHRWNASDIPFPMWGETSTPLLITPFTSAIDDILMLRMVARIDVAVAKDDPVSGRKPREHFKLAEVYLYNIKDNGHIVPDRNALASSSPGNLIVDKPTVPTDPGNWAGPILYTTGDEVSLTGEMYILEAKATVFSQNRLDATGLVIGGYYSSDGVVWDTERSYYRLDMTTTDKTRSRDILRNHNYRLRIVEVTGPGSPTPRIAWESATPMDLMVAEWNIQTVSGDILSRRLNTSSARAVITGMTASRIYFWSDQPTVMIDEEGDLGGSGRAGKIPFRVNDFFDDLAGAVNTSMFHYDPLSGEGYMDIATISAKQVNNDVRHIYLNANGLRREITVSTRVAYQPRPFNEFPWVGTFHRSDEVGERVIYSDHTGAWSAQVDDPMGGGSFVILSKVPGNNKDLGTESPGNAEDYPVRDGVKSVEGNGRIYFRVGMASTYTPTPTAPARYATITVNYSDGGATAKIYVRQGEGADYVMRNGDPPVAGVDTELTRTRTLAKKFSPYNLTDPQRGVGRVGNATGTKYVFTDYPTQGGYYFQWGRTYAWDPRTVKAVNWNWNNIGGNWDNNKRLWETCPAGYRRPNDGSTATAGTGMANDSEIRQSLFSNPRNGWEGVPANNALWGYYADGFFDRRPIRTSITDVPASATGADAELAYLGRLFFNPYTHASVFLPAAGVRKDPNNNPGPLGALSYAGSMCVIWSATYSSSTDASYLSNNRLFAHLWRAGQRNGISIRCIKDE